MLKTILITDYHNGRKTREAIGTLANLDWSSIERFAFNLMQNKHIQANIENILYKKEILNKGIKCMSDCFETKDGEEVYITYHIEVKRIKSL